MKTDFILSDSDYEKQMDTLVIPYLKQHMKELYIERESQKPIYCACYTADSPKGIILISHGYTESADKYKEIAYYFVRAGYHTYIMEHCGHGRSYRLVTDLSLVYTDRFERYVEDLLFIARTAQQEHPLLPMYLFGHSMGGGIAAAAAAAAPSQFQRVILSSPMIRPSTGNVPWQAARFISAIFCLFGKGTDYVSGQHPYEGPEQFETSASLSESRFLYYRGIKHKEPLFQTSAASYGWMHEAIRLSRFLQTKAWKKIQTPILLFQAGQDNFVSNQEQEQFVQKLNRKKGDIRIGNSAVPFAQLIRIADARHEIFSSDMNILKPYWKSIFDFLES